MPHIQSRLISIESMFSNVGKAKKKNLITYPVCLKSDVTTRFSTSVTNQFHELLSQLTIQDRFRCRKSSKKMSNRAIRLRKCGRRTHRHQQVVLFLQSSELSVREKQDVRAQPTFGSISTIRRQHPHPRKTYPSHFQHLNHDCRRTTAEKDTSW